MATKSPQLEHLLPLYDALEEARQAFLDACDEIPLPPPLTEALAAWRQAAEAWVDALEKARVNPEPFEPLRFTVAFASTPPSLDVENEVLAWTSEMPTLDVQD